MKSDITSEFVIDLMKMIIARDNIPANTSAHWDYFELLFECQVELGISDAKMSPTASKLWEFFPKSPSALQTCKCFPRLGEKGEPRMTEADKRAAKIMARATAREEALLIVEE